MLGITFLPALATSPLANQGLSCLDNTRQLSRALLLYSSDYQDYLPPNPPDGNTRPFCNWIPGMAGIGGQMEFNPDLLTDPTRSLLFPYLNVDPQVFRCPSDPREGRYSGTNLEWRAAHKTVPATRSYSMNIAIGTNPYKNGGKSPVDGGWLDGYGGHTANKTWFTFATINSMNNPGPARTFVFLDEDPYSINDGKFNIVGPYPGHQNYKMIDWPGSFHDYGANFGFADGHAESHTWKDARTGVKNGRVTVAILNTNVDIEWMSTRATALVRQPQLTAIGSADTNGFRVKAYAYNGSKYTLEYNDSLSSTNWKPISQIMATNTGFLEFSDTNTTSDQRFYRAWTR